MFYLNKPSRKVAIFKVIQLVCRKTRHVSKRPSTNRRTS